MFSVVVYLFVKELVSFKEESFFFHRPPSSDEIYTKRNLSNNINRQDS